MSVVGTSTIAGTPVIARVQWRTGWKAILGWVLGLFAVLAVSAASIIALYDTDEKLRGYAESITGGAMYMLNGRVAGTDTVGGVMANEFGFVVAFFVPIMALALVSRSTRRDEEAGRLELLLASRIGRHAPLLAALLIALGALLALAVLTSVTMIGLGADAGGALLYGAALVGLGSVHAGSTAVLAQVFEHNRGVWSAGLAVVVLTYLLRGVGAVQDSWVLWASPLGWFDEVRAFGDDARAWPLLISLAVTVALVVLAFALAARHDVGAALLRSRKAPARASRVLRSPFGLALHEHRGPIIGWLILSLALMATYGGLTKEIISALEANPDLTDFIGGGGGEQILEQIEAMFVMMQTMLTAAFVVQAMGSLRAEEDTGRLEAQLVQGRSRPAWLGVHVLVVALGAVLIQLIGSLTLGASTAAALGESRWTGDLLRAGVAHLPVLLLFLGLTVALLGLWPKGRMLAWVVFGLAAVVSYMGPGIDLPQWLIDISPFTAVGSPPAEDVDLVAVAVLAGVGLALLVAGFVGFRRRDVPRG